MRTSFVLLAGLFSISILFTQDCFSQNNVTSIPSVTESFNYLKSKIEEYGGGFQVGETSIIHTIHDDGSTKAKFSMSSDSCYMNFVLINEWSGNNYLSYDSISIRIPIFDIIELPHDTLIHDLPGGGYSNLGGTIRTKSESIEVIIKKITGRPSSPEPALRSYNTDNIYLILDWYKEDRLFESMQEAFANLLVHCSKLKLNE